MCQGENKSQILLTSQAWRCKHIFLIVTDRTPRADIYVFPKERERDNLQSGTNRIIQEMSDVCSSVAKITLLLKTNGLMLQCFVQKVCLNKMQRDRYGGLH